MTVDALENGGDDSFPNCPRLPDGRLDTTRMPIGKVWQRGKNGQSILIDQEPTVRLTNGRLVKISEVIAP